jgi:hypothetical protein
MRLTNGNSTSSALSINPAASVAGIMLPTVATSYSLLDTARRVLATLVCLRSYCVVVWSLLLLCCSALWYSETTSMLSLMAAVGSHLEPAISTIRLRQGRSIKPVIDPWLALPVWAAGHI